MSNSKRARVDYLSLKPVSLSDRQWFSLVHSLESANAEVLTQDTVHNASVSSRRGEMTSEYHALAQTCQQVFPLKLTNGEELQWQVQRPAQLFKFFYDRSTGYRCLVDSCMGSSSSMNWHIVFYCDEITPGNVIKPCNRRRAYCFYFAFREFGRHIRDELAWLPICVLRDSIIDKLPGGLSHVLKLLVGTFFTGHVNFHEGFLLGDRRFTAELSNILADEAALRSIWSCKGAAGMKPCFCCKNIISMHSTIHDYMDNTYFATVDHFVCADFDLNSDESIWTMVDSLALQHNAVNKVTFDQLQMCMGLTFNPHGLLADASLRVHVKPISCHTWDFMHTYLQGGVAAVEAHLFLEAMKQKLGVKFADLAAFCNADWKFLDYRIKSNISNVFSDDREACTHDSFKGNASELLSALPVLAHFAEQFSRIDIVKDEVSSLLALMDVIHLIGRLLV